MYNSASLSVSLPIGIPFPPEASLNLSFSIELPTKDLFEISGSNWITKPLTLADLGFHAFTLRGTDARSARFEELSITVRVLCNFNSIKLDVTAAPFNNGAIFWYTLGEFLTVPIPVIIDPPECPQNSVDVVFTTDTDSVFISHEAATDHWEAFFIEPVPTSASPPAPGLYPLSLTLTIQVT